MYFSQGQRNKLKMDYKTQWTDNETGSDCYRIHGWCKVYSVLTDGRRYKNGEVAKYQASLK